MTDIIIQAFHVLDELKQDSKFLEMKALNITIGEKYGLEVKNFQETKTIYDNILAQGGTYHPDFKNAVKDYAHAKSMLYGKPEVMRYFSLEKEFQDEINDFLRHISEYISPHIKTPNKLGIVQKGGSCHVR